MKRFTLALSLAIVVFLTPLAEATGCIIVGPALPSFVATGAWLPIQVPHFQLYGGFDGTYWWQTNSGGKQRTEPAPKWIITQDPNPAHYIYYLSIIVAGKPSGTGVYPGMAIYANNVLIKTVPAIRCTTSNPGIVYADLSSIVATNNWPAVTYQLWWDSPTTPQPTPKVFWKDKTVFVQFAPKICMPAIPPDYVC